MEQFSKYQNNLKKSWDIIKIIINKRKNVKHRNIRLLVNGIPTENKSRIANCFNNFFTDIGENLDKNIPKSNMDPISFIKKNFTINIFLQPTSPA